MKKTVLALLIAVVAIAGIAGVGVAYAQGANPEASTPGDGTTFGNGMKGNRGANRAAAGQAMGQALRGDSPGIGDGTLHDAFIAFYADAFNLDATVLETRLEAGETMADIAVAEGLTLDEFQALRLDARQAAIAQAVADGTLTQEQADLMNQGGFGRMGNRGAGGGRGAAGQGQFANPDCPLYEGTQP